MSIRKANKTDKVPIQALMDELNLYRKKIFSSENQEFHERINPYKNLEDQDFDESFIFVATDGDSKIVGFIQGSMSQRNNHRLSKLGYIDELYVQEEFRGKGFAKNLFSELESEFKKQGCDHITTHTDFENELSQQFYLQNGMNKTTVELWKKL
jgi:ribosomal protein S18 acetylase RimI-like enzyme